MEKVIVILLLLTLPLLAIDSVKLKSGRTFECTVIDYAKNKIDVKINNKTKRIPINKISTIAFDVKETGTNKQNPDNNKTKINLNNITKDTIGKFTPPISLEFGKTHNGEVITLSFIYREDFTKRSDGSYEVRLCESDHNRVIVIIPPEGLEWLQKTMTFSQYNNYVWRGNEIELKKKFRRYLHCVVASSEVANKLGMAWRETILYALGGTKLTQMGGTVEYSWGN